MMPVRRPRRNRASKAESDREAADFVAELRLIFETTHHPEYVWRAYQTCRRAGLPLADWIVAYFDAVAQRWEFAHVDDDDRRHWAVKVAEVFGFQSNRSGGPADALKREQREAKAYELALRLRVYVDGDGLNETNAISVVAEQQHMPESTVRRAWKRYQRVVRRDDAAINRQRKLIAWFDDLDNQRHKPA